MFSELLESLELDDHDGLVATLELYLVRARDFESVISRDTQTTRRNLYPSESDAAEARRERLPFSGDIQHGPPLAWVVGWSGRYVNRYGPAIPAPLKAWGHVFWDRRRLIESKGLNAVLRERDGYCWG